MHNFTPLSALLGGLLIGLATSLMLLFAGKIAGISGIVGGFLRPAREDSTWRGAFLGGLLLGGVALRLACPTAFGSTAAPLTAVAIAGLLVGYGTRLGNGCTSGHGICGNSRPSLRSIVATVTFMATGALTVFVVRRLFGGAS